MGGSVFGTPLTGTSGVGFGAVVLRHQFAVVLHPIQRQVVGVFTVTPATFDVLGPAHGAVLAVGRLGVVCLHSATEVVSLKSVNDIAGLEASTKDKMPVVGSSRKRRSKRLTFLEYLFHASR